jgi:hypothetical protein
MVERPSLFFHNFLKTDNILAVRLEELFWARNVVECMKEVWILGFGLHAMPGQRFQFL